MYATSVGLVLAGFKSLDEREEGYKKRLANSIPAVKTETKEFLTKDIFRSIGAKLKGIITDDIGDDITY